MSEQTDKHWVIVPAAGSGRRMGVGQAKQYFPLATSTVLAITLERLAAGIAPESIVVALSADDAHWPTINKPNIAVIRVEGGSERCYSVLNGLRALKSKAADNDWVWVHDAARPCVRTGDLGLLKHAIKEHSIGGLLALKITDTVKHADEAQTVIDTVDRDSLWRALTPQVFRYQLLLQALEKAVADGINVTDEAQAMELQGHHPLLVAGSSDNIKITTPGDLELAEFYLQQQLDSYLTHRH